MTDPRRTGDDSVKSEKNTASAGAGGVYWRILEKGEILQPADEYKDPYNGLWFQTKCVGCEVGIPRKTSFTYHRRYFGAEQVANVETCESQGGGASYNAAPTNRTPAE